MCDVNKCVYRERERERERESVCESNVSGLPTCSMELSEWCRSVMEVVLAGRCHADGVESCHSGTEK